jgi:hypothetical protein
VIKRPMNQVLAMFYDLSNSRRFGHVWRCYIIFLSPCIWISTFKECLFSGTVRFYVLHRNYNILTSFLCMCIRNFYV